MGSNIIVLVKKNRVLRVVRVVNALISLCLGLFLATVGVDTIYGADRFAFGQPFLLDGIEFLLVMVGAYGIGEVLSAILNTISDGDGGGGYWL